jgi:hypothetical protein
MASWRITLMLMSGALLGCAAKPPDLRPPAEITAPSPNAWRVAARDLAAAIAKGAAARELSGPAILDPVQGSAPPYFRDLLLANLVENGMKVAETGESPLHLACRTTQVGVVPPTRGFTTDAAPLPPGEVFVLCLLARDGAYIASAQHSLSVPASTVVPAGGTVIEVKG